jgi:hypothetical protein
MSMGVRIVTSAVLGRHSMATIVKITTGRVSIFTARVSIVHSRAISVMVGVCLRATALPFHAMVCAGFCHWGQISCRVASIVVLRRAFVTMAIAIVMIV